MDLILQVSSRETARAAAAGGADGVAFRVAEQSWRELEDTIKYCHVRGLKAGAELSGFLTDAGEDAFLAAAGRVNALGADFLTLSDAGALLLAHEVFPLLPLTAGADMALDTPEAALFALKTGASTVCVPPLLGFQKASAICRAVDAELYAQGFMCMAPRSRCLMPAALTGERALNAPCPRPCGRGWGYSMRDELPLLALRELSLAGHIEKILKSGAVSVRINAENRSVEYASAAVALWRRALDEKRPPEPSELKVFEDNFTSRGGTDATVTEARGDDMYALQKPNVPSKKLLAAAAALSRGAEPQRVPIRLFVSLKAGQPATLALEDGEGRMCMVEGGHPDRSKNNPTPEAQIRTQLYRTQGTPYLCASAGVKMEPELHVPQALVKQLLKHGLDKLSWERSLPPARPVKEASPLSDAGRGDGKGGFTFSVRSARQLSRELAAFSPEILYIPIYEALLDPEALTPFLREGTRVAVSLPVSGDENLLSRALNAAKKLGASAAELNGFFGLEASRECGLELFGGPGLNILSSRALAALKNEDISRAFLSPLLSFKEASALKKAIPVEVMLYGRLTLLTSENCLLKKRRYGCSCGGRVELTDENGANFPALREGPPGCRSALFSRDKLFVPEKTKTAFASGARAGRLCFTTENPRECVQAAAAYLSGGKWRPNEAGNAGHSAQRTGVRVK